MYKLLFHKQAKKDLELIKTTALRKNVYRMLELLETNPFKYPPEYEKLNGDLEGMYSRRINKQHRIVYTVTDDVVKIYQIWTHYEKM